MVRRHCMQPNIGTRIFDTESYLDQIQQRRHTCRYSVGLASPNGSKARSPGREPSSHAGRVALGIHKPSPANSKKWRSVVGRSASGISHHPTCTASSTTMNSSSFTRGATAALPLCARRLARGHRCLGRGGLFDGLLRLLGRPLDLLCAGSGLLSLQRMVRKSDTPV